jgi:hypothetical protein
MTFDLRSALLRKEEFESARLDDFAFRLRARTMRMLGAALEEFGSKASIDGDVLVGRIAELDDATILQGLLDDGLAIDAEALYRLYSECRERARRDLIGEIGDPAPHRLA